MSGRLVESHSFVDVCWSFVVQGSILLTPVSASLPISHSNADNTLPLSGAAVLTLHLVPWIPLCFVINTVSQT